MLGIFEIGIIFFTLAAVFGGMLALLWFVMRASRGGERRGSPDEARTMQELHQGFARIDKRVEALEAILMEHCGDRFSPAREDEETETSRP